MKRAILLAVVLAAAAPAGAESFWRDAPKKSTSPKDRQRAIEEGDRRLQLARRIELQDVNGSKPPSVLEHARGAVAAYERALELGPDDAELHYRAIVAAKYIDDHHSQMGLCAACRDGYEAVVKHVDAMRKADPRDRHDIDVTWDVAIALSKRGGLGGPDADQDFERAVAEYEHWRHLADEANPDHAGNVAIAYSNAAELLMAVGKLEEAIEQYRAAVDLNPGEPLGLYGLAVAYDRDGQADKAKAAMAEALTRDPAVRRLTSDDVFFVPEGDVFYYEALAYQVRGDPQTAAAYYGRFLVHAQHSGRSRYVQRATEHLEELKKGAR